MTLWVCMGCSTAYAVGHPSCPMCGSSDHIEDGEVMPKVSAYGGASDKSTPPVEESVIPEVIVSESESGEILIEIASEAVSTATSDLEATATTGVNPPPRSAVKGVWVAWAIDHGMNPIEAESHTRNQLVDWWYAQ